MNEKELLKKFGMTGEQIEADVRIIEDENADDELIEPIYYGSHLRNPEEEHMVTISLRLPESLLNKANSEAKKYHISRSEYLRRKLLGATR